MKHILPLIFTCCLLYSLKVQTLDFTYDPGGNQIRRELVTIFVKFTQYT